MWGFQNRVCLSVCPYPEKRNHPGFVNISPTLVIDTSMERSSRVLQHGNPKIWFFQKFEIEFWHVSKNWNHLSFVNISPTLVIDRSMERPSQVLQHRNPKKWISLHITKVAKARKNSSVRRHFPRLYIYIYIYIYMVSEAVHLLWKQHLYLLLPNKFLYLNLHHTLMRHY